MRNIKHYVSLFILSLLLREHCLADIAISISGGSYNYDLTSTKNITGGNIKLYDKYYSALFELSLGSLSVDKTIGKYEKKNFKRINYTSSPLILTLDNPITGILLPSIDVKTYDEPNRKFEEKTVSIWLGFLSFSTREDNTNGINIKSTRYGLTTSVFAENMHALFNYAYNNPENVKKNQYPQKNNNETCQTYFGYTVGTASCKKDNFTFIAYYLLSYDYYKIDVEHQNLGDGEGTGFTYGINTIFEILYEITKNNNIAIGIDISNFKGQETITFDNNEIKDDITRKNINMSFKLISRF